MPQITYFVAMPFRVSAEGEIVAGEPQECRDGSRAKRIAAALAADPKNCGTVAFSRTGDPALGDFEDAVIITQIGEVDATLIGAP
jgi:hypothetical protein